MQRMTTTEIDEEMCTGCGLCVDECPTGVISLEGTIARVTDEYCMNCDHCAAVCPENAIVVKWVDEDALKLTTVENRYTWLAYGEYDTAALVNLMRSRRSCRVYDKTPVPAAVLDDLVRVGITAPSGTNSQQWAFTVLSSRDAVMKLGRAVAGFFEKVCRMSESGLNRLASRIFSDDRLGYFYREHYETVMQGLEDMKTGGDMLFHNASAVIVISMKPGASTPCEDAAMASQNILLASHAMGYGTCMIGYAVSAMQNSPSIQAVAGIPRDEKVYSVITVGRPVHEYTKPAGRKTPETRFYGG